MARQVKRAFEYRFHYLRTAFGHFVAERAQYPRHKSRKRSPASAECTRSAFTWRDGRLTRAKTTEPLDIRWSRPLSEDAEPATLTVSRDAAGCWFVSTLCQDTITPTPATGAAVGVDAGITSLATLSTGEKITNPRHERRDRARLAKAQREPSRKTKGPADRAKARVKAARVHARIADRRRDLPHKLSTRLVRDNQTVVIEDLSVRDLVDRWFPSSKRCGRCGTARQRLPLTVREWTCACGVVHDRDVNAARDILAAGPAASACGDGVRPQREPSLTGRSSAKQESRRATAGIPGHWAGGGSQAGTPSLWSSSSRS
jgi:putative transposase